MLNVSVGGQTVDATGLTYSCVDPGGFETASFTVTQPTFTIQAGDDVLVTEGPQVAWQGRVEEPGRQIQSDVLSYSVSAVGYGAELKEQFFSMVYVDSDLNAWTDMSLSRKILLLGAAFSPNNSINVFVQPDTGLPAIETSFDGAWIAGQSPICEALYDAGQGNGIGLIIVNGKPSSANVSVADANWNIYLISAPNSDTSGNVTTSNLRAATWNTSLSVPGYRYGMLLFYYAVAPGGADGEHFGAFWSNISVYGNHNLTVQTGSSVANGVTGAVISGLALSDICADVVKRGTRFQPMILSNNFLVTQFAYKSLTAPSEMLDALRSLTGWHWGVWEPTSILSELPTIWFTPPPPKATVSVFTEDCTELDVTESYTSLHDSIQVKYSDPSGNTGTVAFSNPNPRGKSTRNNVLVVDMGNGTADSAAVFARYVLLLDQADMRAAGSCELPTKLSDGRPAHLIKAGRDKIKIVDYPATVQRIVDSIPVDTFHISRVTVSVTNGNPSTQIEFDQGADLIEVLQARLTQGNAQIGF